MKTFMLNDNEGLLPLSMRVKTKGRSKYHVVIHTLYTLLSTANNWHKLLIVAMLE